MQTRIFNLTDDQTQMVRGIAKILLGVKDIDNRMKLAKDQIQKFKEEEIIFNYAGFLSMAGLDNNGENIYMDIKTQPTHRVHKESTSLKDMMGELYSNPICPRKQNESDEAYKLRCAPLMGPSVLMNLPSVNQTPMGEAMIRSVKDIVHTLIPTDTFARHANDPKKNREWVNSLSKDMATLLNRFYKEHDINVVVKI